MLTVTVSMVAVPAAIDIGLTGVTEHCPENTLASHIALKEPL